MNLTLQISFNKSIAKRQHLLFFKLSWKSYLQSYKMYIIISVIVLLLALIITIKDFTGINNFFWGLLCSLIIMLFSFGQGYFKEKKKFRKRIDNIIVNQNKLTEYSFGEDTISYKNSEMQCSLKWSLFTKYALIKNDLLISMSDNLTKSIIIGKDEISENEFVSLLEMVKNHLPEG